MFTIKRLAGNAQATRSLACLAVAAAYGCWPNHATAACPPAVAPGIVVEAEDSLDSPPPGESALERAIAAQPHTLYLRSGLYRLTRPLVLTGAADGLTLAACPGETPVLQGPPGAAAVVLRGSRNVTLAGLVFTGTSQVLVQLDAARNCTLERNLFVHGTAGILLQGSSHNRLARNVLVGSATTAIELKDGSDANRLTDNVIDGADAPETSGGGIFLHGARNNRIEHNLVQNTQGFGIGVSNWDDATLNVGNTVHANLVRNTARSAQDSGAIYVLGRSGADTAMVVDGNVVDGVGRADRHAVGIYLDDSTSGAVVTGNLVRGAGSDAVEIHGGRNNIIGNNLFDLGAAQPSAVLFQAAPADTHPMHAQTGNAVLQNVILSANAAPRLYVSYDGGTPLIMHNFYAFPRGAEAANDAPMSDLAPSVADPDLAADGYEDGYAKLQRTAAAIGFKPIDLAAAGPRAGGGAGD